MSYDPTKKRIIDTGDNDGASVHDVQQALGITSNQLKDLCTSSNINKWAKFKPISVSGVTPLDSRESLDQSYFQDSKAYGIRGIYIDNQSISYFIEQMAAVLYNPQSAYYPNGFIYLKPSGTSSSPYRLSDFALKVNPDVGYSHNAYLMANYMDSSHNWHPLNIFFTPMVEGVPEAIEKEYPETDTVIEEQSNISSSWESYQYDKALQSLEWPFDANISVHDIMYSLCKNKTRLKNFKHAILFIPEGQQSPSDCKIVVGSFPDKTITQSELRNDGDTQVTYGYVEFYTDLPGTGFVSTTLSGQYNFLPIPCCYGKVKFHDTGDAGGSMVIDSAFAAWNPYLQQYLMGAKVYGVSFNHWDNNKVYLKVGEYPDTGGSGIEITRNSADSSDTFDVSAFVSGNDGDTRYLKLVGIEGGTAKVIDFAEFEIVGGPNS